MRTAVNVTMMVFKLVRSGYREPYLFRFPAVTFPVLEGLRGYVAIQYDTEHGFLAVYSTRAYGSLRGSIETAELTH